MTGFVTGLGLLLPGSAGPVSPRSPERDIGPQPAFAETLAGAMSRQEAGAAPDHRAAEAWSRERQPVESVPERGSGEGAPPESERQRPQMSHPDRPEPLNPGEEAPPEYRATDDPQPQEQETGVEPSGSAGGGETGPVQDNSGQRQVSRETAATQPGGPDSAAETRGAGAGWVPPLVLGGSAQPSGQAKPELVAGNGPGPGPALGSGGSPLIASQVQGAPDGNTPSGTAGSPGMPGSNGDPGQKTLSGPAQGGSTGPATAGGATRSPGGPGTAPDPAAFAAMMRQLLHAGAARPVERPVAGRAAAGLTPSGAAVPEGTGNQPQGAAPQTQGAPGNQPDAANRLTHMAPQATQAAQAAEGEAPAPEPAQRTDTGTGSGQPAGSSPAALTMGVEANSGAAELPRAQGGVHHPSEAASAAEWRQEIQEQVARAMTEARLRASRDGHSEMRIRLEPPELGEISLRLSLRDGQIHGQILAGRPEVRAVLESQKAELWTRLEQQGIQVAGFDVGMAGDSGQGGQERAGAGRREPHRRLGTPAERALAQNPAPEAAGRSYGAWRWSGRLDYRV